MYSVFDHSVGVRYDQPAISENQHVAGHCGGEFNLFVVGQSELSAIAYCALALDQPISDPCLTRITHQRSDQATQAKML